MRPKGATQWTRTNFDRYLNQQLKDPALAVLFRRAERKWGQNPGHSRVARPEPGEFSPVTAAGHERDFRP